VGVELHGELIRLNPATHQPSVYLSGTSATEVAFSPDGQWITYITFPDYILWRSRTDGRDRRQLTSPSGYAEIPRWSPDGKRIAFNWSDAGKPWKVAVISSDGGALEGVIPDREDNQQQGDPTWSPDGEEIIYARDMELRRVDLRTRKVEPIRGSEGLFSPRWSPDGRYLAAFSMDSRSIHMFDFEKQVWTIWFTAKEGHVAWNSWSQDSKALYFATDETGNQGYWRIDVGNKIPKKIADLPDQNLWPVLAPDGSLIYTRDLSIYEVYALHLSEK
jgi:Tol biopolymer transport system component